MRSLVLKKILRLIESSHAQNAEDRRANQGVPFLTVVHVAAQDRFERHNKVFLASSCKWLTVDHAEVRVRSFLIPVPTAVGKAGKGRKENSQSQYRQALRKTLRFG